MTIFHFEINGLATTAQAERISDMLRDLSGVDTVKVDTRAGHITVFGNEADAKRVAQATTLAGYELSSRRDSGRTWRWGSPVIRWYRRGWLRPAY